MNKLFIGLLIIAAGTGIFFLVQKKKSAPQAQSLNKDLIIGQWQTSQQGDSTVVVSRYDFTKDGLLIHHKNDSLKASDTSRYEWNKTNDLVWKTPQDSLGI